MTVPQNVTMNASPLLQSADYDAAAEAMRHGQFGHGPSTEKFEAEVAAFLGVPDVVATASGTAALHIALLLAGVGPGDEVIVPSFTFAATIQAILAAGAAPHFVEVSPHSLCVEPETIMAAITPATRAVMPVHYGGRAVDLREIQPALDKRGITVVEDAAHAFGSYLGTTRVGGTGADVLTCFSFGPIKNLTCLEGGALVPRNEDEAERARHLRYLGIDQSQAERVRATSYSVGGYGLRATMSCVHAAVGCSQLARFAGIAAARQRLWRTYAQRLDEIEQAVLVDVDIDRSVPFNCVVRVPARDEVHRVLRSEGIAVGVHYPPNHLQPGFTAWRRPLPQTEQIGREILSLPFHLRMTDDDVDYVVTHLERALGRAGHGFAEEAV